MVLLSLFICRPVAYNWDPTIPGGTCGNSTTAYLAAHASHFCIDSVIALLPARVLWSLKMPMYKKVATIILFALGALYVLPGPVALL